MLMSREENKYRLEKELDDLYFKLEEVKSIEERDIILKKVEDIEWRLAENV